MSDDAEWQFAKWAADLWRTKGKALLDPDGSFEEQYGRAPSAAIEKHFAEQRVPYRDYSKGGPEWVREAEAMRWQAAVKKTRHGATQPEDERERKPVLIRMRPAVRRKLDAMAREWSLTRSDAVERMVELLSESEGSNE